jgi:hypothetical protein
MKLLTQVLLLTIIDYLLIWFIVRQLDLDLSASLTIIILVPFAVGLNLIIALIFAYTKPEYIKLFAINSIIAGLVMYHVFTSGIHRYQNRRYNGWTFKIKDTAFDVTLDKLDTTFYITYQITPGSSMGYLDGTYKKMGNEYILSSDKGNFLINNNKILEFRQRKDTINLIQRKY